MGKSCVEGGPLGSGNFAQVTCALIKAVPFGGSLYFPGTCSTRNSQLHPSASHWTSPQESQCIAVIAGASANNYLLASKSTAGVQSGTGKLNLASDMAAAKTGDGGLATTFTLKLPAGAEAPTASTDCM